MQERYRVSDESLTNLSSWLSEVETRIASLGALHEDVNRLAHQQAVAKVSLIIPKASGMFVSTCPYIRKSCSNF